jgi:hypothetical protein
MQVYDRDRDDPSKIIVGSTIMEGFMNKQHIIRTILSLFIILIGLSTSAGSGGTRWKTIRVDAGMTFRYLTNSSLKLFEPAPSVPNIPSIAYGSDHLYYATYVEGDFVTTIVDDSWGVGMFASLALDPTNGYPRISYYDQTINNLKYAEYNEVLGVPVWNTRTLTGGGNPSAIALDNSSAHLPHIIYSDRDGHVRHAWLPCSSCSWSYEDVDMAVETSGTNIVLAIDPSNELHIAYYDSLTSTLYYRKTVGGIWASAINLGNGREPSLAITSAGFLGITYETDSTINYVTNDTGGWVTHIVYDDSSASGFPGGSSLQLPNDDLDQPRISFIDGDDSVRLAFWDEMDPSCPGTDGDFNCPIIEGYPTFRSFTSLVVEQSPLYNLSRIVYIDESTGELRYRFESTPDVWGSQAIDYSTNAGLSSSLAVDASGPHIAYIDRDATTLKYAGIDDSVPGGCGEDGLNAWYECEGLDNAVVGSNASIAIGIDGFPHIAFYDRDRPGALRYGTLDPIWSAAVIDGSSTDIGRYASIALNPAFNLMSIAYMDYTNGHLKYAQKLVAPTGNCGPDDFWFCETIDDIGSGGMGISLTFGFNNIPIISYLDGDAQLVKVARYRGIAGGSTCPHSIYWDCNPIAPGYLTDRGQTSIWANTADSQVMVSWYQYNISASNLMWSQYFLGAGWLTPEVVADAMYSGEQNSLTTIGGTPVIAYTDGRFNSNALNYAYRVGVDGDCDSIEKWSCEVLDSVGTTGFYPSIKNISGRLYISYYDWTNGDLMLTFQAYTFVPRVVKP